MQHQNQELDKARKAEVAAEAKRDKQQQTAYSEWHEENKRLDAAEEVGTLLNLISRRKILKEERRGAPLLHHCNTPGG
jgi:hypothetical protein